MSDADSDNPTWKADLYGANYDQSLGVKQEYDESMFFYAPKAVGVITGRWGMMGQCGGPGGGVWLVMRIVIDRGR
jgi:hypothetical protein